jgi:threonine dehydratase
MTGDNARMIPTEWQTPPATEDVRAARTQSREHLVDTLFLNSRTRSLITDCQLVLKFENLQFTAPFRERGVLNRLVCLIDDERSRGVITASTSNHAQGPARAIEALQRAGLSVQTAA